MILRLPIKVRLFNEKSELVAKFNSTKKSQIRLRVHGVSRNKWTFGVCTVSYDKSGDYFNKFTFLNEAQLLHGLTVDTEKPLIEYLKDIIPRQYQRKRQLTAAQRLAIAKAQRKSSFKVVS